MVSSIDFGENGYAKPSIVDFLMYGRMVNHNSHGSKPPMSIRVIALNSFVLPIRKVVSEMLVCRVVALMEVIKTDYRLFVCVFCKMEFCSPRRFKELPCNGYAAIGGMFL